MVYILILSGFIFLLYSISRFMEQSNSPRAKGMFRYGGAVILGVLAFFFLALAKNLAVGGILALLSFMSAQGGLWKILVRGRPAARQSGGPRQPGHNNNPPSMSREEALDILGLSGNPGPADIRDAHHKLMLKIHPDQGGSDYFASKLNQARDLLLQS